MLGPLLLSSSTGSQAMPLDMVPHSHGVSRATCGQSSGWLFGWLWVDIVKGFGAVLAGASSLPSRMDWASTDEPCSMLIELFR